MGRGLPGRLPGRHDDRGRDRRHRLPRGAGRGTQRPAHAPLPQRRTSRRTRCSSSCSGARRPIPISDVLPTIENLGPQADQRAALRDRRCAGRLLDPGLRARASAWRAASTWRATARASRRRSRASGSGERTTTASTASCSPRTSTGARRWCSGPMRAGSGSSGLPLSQAYVEEALASNAAAAGRLLRLFKARFDPARRGAAPQARRRHASAARSSSCSRGVTRIDDDRILRASSPRSTRRCAPITSRPAADGEPKSYLVASSSTRARLAEVAAAEADVRDLRALAARRGRAPAHGPRRARRPALVGPPRGLPHRDPRAS